jgi:hypothetical protein
MIMELSTLIQNSKNEDILYVQLCEYVNIWNVYKIYFKVISLMYEHCFKNLRIYCIL